MKRKIRQLSVVIFLVSFCSSSFESFAGHVLGGEIYWKCIKSGSNQGKYEFYINIYRKCSGTLLPAIQNITGPNGTIPTSVSEINDLSPNCWDPNNAMSCQSTTNGDPVEQYIYKSQPVTLTGTPPTGGWTFSWTSCCRPQLPITDNLSTQGGAYYLEAKMFPYIPLGSLTPNSADDCYDSSPEFVEHPTTLICKGISGYMDYATSDREFDLTTFEFVSGRTSGTNNVTYATHLNTSQVSARANGGGFIVPSPGFSPQVPLPWSHSNMDTKNIPGLLNTGNGMVKFHSYTQGVYLVTVKVNSFKHGQKVAEITREMYIEIANCLGTNTAPTVSLTDTSLTDTISLNDTVLVGDLYNMSIIATDVEFNSLSPIILQKNKLTVVSAHIGDSIYNNTGCLVEPCAYIDSSRSSMSGNEVEGTAGIQALFEWQTHCDHMQGARLDSNGNYYRDYLFKFDITDDFCPIPATTTKLLTITVMDTVHPYPEIAKIDNNGTDIEIIWNNSGTFPGYNVVRDSGYTGNANVIDSVLVLNAHYIDSGKGGTPHNFAYQLQNRSRSACVPGKWYQSTSITAEHLGGREVELNWNGHIPFDVNTEIWYLVYSRSVGGNWIFEDSVQLGYDSLVLTQQPCDVYRLYKVEAHYNNGFLSISNADSVYIEHVDPIIVGQNGTWQAPPSQSYTWYLNGQLISGATNSVYPMINGGYIQVAMNDSNGCPVLTDSLLAIQLDVSHKKAATLDQDWNDYDPNTMPANSWYKLERKDTSGVWLHVDSLPFGTSTYRDGLVLCDAAIPYRVIAYYENGSVVYSNEDDAMVQTQVPIIVVNGNLLQSPQASTYQWMLDGAPIAGATTQNWTALTNGVYHVVTEDSNTCLGSSNEIVITWTTIGSLSEQRDVKLYPVPVHDVLNIEMDGIFDLRLNLQVIDITGKVVLEENKTMNNQLIQLDFSDIRSGVYLLKITDENQQRTLRIVKE